ncbi:MAG TPA: hypothetical protein DFI01_10725 [Bacteroidales bacterium]|mgnify:CR=1 FL=1|nr:hypothetical protein [Bacteroidales bacterium]
MAGKTCLPADVEKFNIFDNVKTYMMMKQSDKKYLIAYFSRKGNNYVGESISIIMFVLFAILIFYKELNLI